MQPAPPDSELCHQWSGKKWICKSETVYLTEKGTQLCRQIVIPLIEAEQHSLAQMTAEEVELCLKLSVRQLDLFEEELALILPKKEHPSGE